MSKINRIVTTLRTWLSDPADDKAPAHREDQPHQQTDAHDLVYSFPKSVRTGLKTRLSIGSSLTDDRNEQSAETPVLDASANVTSALEEPDLTPTLAIGPPPAEAPSQPLAIHLKASTNRLHFATAIPPEKTTTKRRILNHSIKGFDFASAIVMLGDEELILQMIEIFLKDSAETINTLTDHINKQRYGDAQYRLHALIGSAGILGATDLRAAAEQLDRALKQRTMIEPAFEQFKTAFQTSQATLMSMLQSDSQNNSEARASADAKHHADSLASKSILLADDNQFVQHAMQALLQRHGWRVAIAGNGQEAVSAVKRGRFDLVLMDVQMPILDGLEATKLIRSIKANTALPIIGLSASANTAERTACLASGMTDLIAKTTSPDQLIALINAHTATGGC